MGNRGIIHEDWKIVRRQATRAWLVCALEFKGKKRELMQPGCYTELFFLDEATALAAGHRPCFTCQRDNAKAFRSAFGVKGMPDIDRVLAGERKTQPSVTENALYPGTMIASGDEAYLFTADGYRRWSLNGYGAAQTAPPDMRLLTPVSTVAALRAGYRPTIHPSALD